MKRKYYSPARLGEEYSVISHPSGLDLVLFPMKGFTGAYATFVTKYGSIDTCFKTQNDADFVEVPEGIAHFLEHKLFEGENGEDAFTRYAQTGANANAYTPSTAPPMFSCLGQFSDSLRFCWMSPPIAYFHAGTVQKEQGIIGSKSRTGEDNPRVARIPLIFSECGLPRNPDRIRHRSGTVESIAQIEARRSCTAATTPFTNCQTWHLVVNGQFQPRQLSP
jgi:predicted Zn-dependent peptidase